MVAKSSNKDMIRICIDIYLKNQQLKIINDDKKLQRHDFF